MRKKLNLLYYILLLMFSSTALAPAGQVVTEDVKAWAQRTVAQEKALQAVLDPNSVAVLYFYNKTGMRKLDPFRKGLALMLITDLSQLKGISLVERIRLQALTQELELGESGLVEPQTAPRVGRLLGAAYIISGDMIKGALEKIKINSNLLDVMNKTVFGSPMTEGIMQEFFRMEKEILFEIIKLLKIKLTSQEKNKLQKPLSTNTNALFFLFQGIEKSDQGKYREAADFYKKALQHDPRLKLAGDALSELQQLGLLKKKKRSRSLLKELRDRTSLSDRLTKDNAVKRARTPKDVEKRQSLKPKPITDIDNDGDGYTENQGDCNDNDASINPGATETCGDGIDQDCNGIDPACPPDPNDVDNDGDGYTENQNDCNDNDASINPGATEICGDGTDQDCNGTDLDCNDVDNDGDGYTENQNDCNDNDASINPGAAEICNDNMQVDEDCDGLSNFADPDCGETAQ